MLCKLREAGSDRNRDISCETFKGSVKSKIKRPISEKLNQNTQNLNQNSFRDPDGIFGVKRQSQGDVTVYLTLVRFDEGKLTVKFDDDTRFIDDLIQYKLEEMIVLDNQSRTIKPITTPRTGTHHNSGKLVFETFDLPRYFLIIITGLNSRI